MHPALTRRLLLALSCCGTLMVSGALAPAPIAAQRGAQSRTVVTESPDYRIYLDAEQRVVNLVLPLERYEAIRGQEFITRDDARLLSRLVLEHFEDAFDFMLIAFDARQPWAGNDTLAGLNFRVRAVADGLGLATRPEGESFGSGGRLASVSLLRTPAHLRNGLALHEIAHTWGQSVVATDKRSHWGRSSAYGQLGGWPSGQIVREADGVFAPRGNRNEWPPNRWEHKPEAHRRYGELELYLMGLLPPDSVTPIEVAIGARPVPGRGAAFRAERIDTITIGQIVAEHGERVPSWRTSQRAFRGVFVIVSFLALPPAELARASELARTFALAGTDRATPVPNFWEATGGRASLQLDELAATLRPIPRAEQQRRAAEATARHCAATLADSLRALQRQVLAAVPQLQEFPASEWPAGALAGYQLVHGYGVIRGMGLTLVNVRAVEPFPPILFYMPVDTAGQRDWTDFFNPDGPYRLTGWGYQVLDRGGVQPPQHACIPTDAWFTREAGWHLRDGSVLLTPGADRAPARPPGVASHIWRPRTLAVHIWVDENGIPRLSREDVRAPNRGIDLPAELFPSPARQHE
jgi:hypothetical protein